MKLLMVYDIDTTHVSYLGKFEVSTNSVNIKKVDSVEDAFDFDNTSSMISHKTLIEAIRDTHKGDPFQFEYVKLKLNAKDKCDRVIDFVKKKKVLDIYKVKGHNDIAMFLLEKDIMDVIEYVKKVEQKEEIRLTTKSVVLVNHGAKKIAVIKVVREMTGLGLKEAKYVVDSSPTPVLRDVDNHRAEEAKQLLEEAGAVVDIVHTN